LLALVATGLAQLAIGLAIAPAIHSWRRTIRIALRRRPIIGARGRVKFLLQPCRLWVACPSDVATSGTAAGATLVAPNPITAGVAVTAGSIAIYNGDFTKQSILWCFGVGDIPTAPKIPGFPPNFPPRPGR